MEVSSIHIIIVLVTSQFFLLSWAFYSLNFKLSELPFQEIPQLTQTQQVLIGISQ